MTRETDIFSTLLELKALDTTRFEAGPSIETADRTFGGQFLAQSIVAAQRTVSSDKQIHSLHAYFLSPGDSADPAELSVSVLRDGRSFSHRQVCVYQGDKERFRMIASWAKDLDCPTFVGHIMPQVPLPSAVNYTYLDFYKDQMPDKDYVETVSNRPIDIKYINPPQTRHPTSTLEPQLMWLRIRDAQHLAPAHQAAALAYVSDSTLIDHIALPHGRRWMDSDFDGTSLDHTMYFHATNSMQDWILFEQIVEWTGSGRGLAVGRLFAQDGTLLSTCTQEGLLRF